MKIFIFPIYNHLHAKLEFYIRYEWKSPSWRSKAAYTRIFTIHSRIHVPWNLEIRAPVVVSHVNLPKLNRVSSSVSMSAMSRDMHATCSKITRVCTVWFKQHKCFAHRIIFPNIEIDRWRSERERERERDDMPFDLLLPAIQCREQAIIH